MTEMTVTRFWTKIYKEVASLCSGNAQRQRSRKIKVDEDYFESCIDAFQRSELEF